MHFTQARDTLMQKYCWNRKMATIAVRIAKRIDNFKILAACTGFCRNPIITPKELKQIMDRLPKIRSIILKSKERNEDT